MYITVDMFLKKIEEKNYFQLSRSNFRMC